MNCLFLFFVFVRVGFNLICAPLIAALFGMMRVVCKSTVCHRFKHSVLFRYSHRYADLRLTNNNVLMRECVRMHARLCVRGVCARGCCVVVCVVIVRTMCGACLVCVACCMF